MIDPARVCLFVPPELRKVKLALFQRIGATITRAGGSVCLGDFAALARLPRDVIPIVGCTPELGPMIQQWRDTGRPWIYWDRGYWLRVYATWLPRGEAGGLYRWHLGSFQQQAITEVPSDRYNARPAPVQPWNRNGKHIVVAEPTPTYQRFHRIEGWTAQMIEALRRITDRPIVTRDKESKRPLQDDLDGAHCLVAHGSNAAVEAVILGCPVIVARSSAAALVGRTSLGEIEQLAYPDRTAWLRSLSYSQFNEQELVDGTLWRLLG